MKMRRRLSGAAYAAAALALLALCLLGPASASAQWTQPDASSNINSTNSGNVGVGTASPTLKLTVGSATQQDGRVLVEGADGGSNLLFNTGGNNRARFTTLSNGLHLQSYSSAWARSDFFIRNDGNVGIGTTAPGARLDVGAGAAARGGNTDLLLGAGGNLPQLEFFGASKSAAIQYDDSGGMLFYTNAPSWTQTLFLGNSGWVGVGTSAPSSQFHVQNSSGAGFVRVTGLGGGVMNFEDTSAATNQRLYQWRSEGGLFRMALSNDAGTGLMQQNILTANSSGNVGVGKTPTASYRLDVLGGLNVSDSLCIAGDCKSSWSQLGGQWAAAASGISYGGGNVGVGTASPGERLELYDASASVRLKIGTGGAAANSSLVLNAAGGRTSIIQKQTAGVNGGQALFYAADDAGGRLFAIDGTNGFGDSSAELMVKRNGSVGIGTPSPDTNYKLDVEGDVKVSGNISAKYQDVAEWVPSSQKLSAGTVVVLDTTQTNHVLASTKAYDTGVAGVISDMPGVILGQGGADKVKVATTGRVKVKVDATRAPIKVGDLLVTSEVEGVAMKSVPVDLGGVRIHRPGTIIGKALEPLEKGTAEILVLLSLQ